MALLWLAVPPLAAEAHAVLVSTAPPDLCSPLVVPRPSPGDPRCASGTVLRYPPLDVRLTFNEPVDPIGGGARVLSPSGRRVDYGPPRIHGSQITMRIAAREVGTYLVRWRVVADDTHPSSGAFVFSVRHASSPPGGIPAATGAFGPSALGLSLQILGRALHFAGYGLGFGVLAFHLIVLRPAAATGTDVERRMWGLVNAGVLALVVAEPLALLAQARSLGEGLRGVLDPEVVSGILESSFGRVLLQRLGAAVLLWVLAGALPEAPGRVVRTSWGVVILGVALAFVDGGAAHAAGSRVPWLGLAMNTVHESAMGLWVGGLAVLILIWPLPDLDARRGEVAARSGLAVAASLTVLALSGTVMAAQHLTGPTDLLSTAYGRTLTAKVSLFLVVLFFAFRAVRVALPRREGWWRREAVALLGVLVLAGLLVSLRPPT